jgi:O-antigen/teichoic acid export membrane protein
MNLGRLFALGSLASTAPLVEFASRFGRTIILSRFLSPTEFGIASALAVLMGIAELSTDLALDRILILRSVGDDREALAAAHRLSVARGGILALVVLVAAPWVAAFLGAPDNDWGFRAVAGVILLRSCTHLEMKQAQRDFRYAPDAMAYIAAHTAVFLAVYPAARLLGDHRAMIVVMFVECGTYVAVSHVVARHR